MFASCSCSTPSSQAALLTALCTILDTRTDDVPACLHPLLSVWDCLTCVADKIGRNITADTRKARRRARRTCMGYQHQQFGARPCSVFVIAQPVSVTIRRGPWCCGSAWSVSLGSSNRSRP
eukprot:1157029-Pelagomonas_calceolata.AAC.3